MPFMYTCTHCGKERTDLAEWRKESADLVRWRKGYESIRVCGSVECEVKARKAGFRRAL